MKFNKASIRRRLNKSITQFIAKLEVQKHALIDYEISDGPWYGEPIIYLKDDILKAVEYVHYNLGSELILHYKYKVNRKAESKEAAIKVALCDGEFASNLKGMYAEVLSLYKERQLVNSIYNVPISIGIHNSPKLVDKSDSHEVYEYTMYTQEHISNVSTSFVLKTDSGDIPIDLKDLRAVVRFNKTGNIFNVSD